MRVFNYCFIKRFFLFYMVLTCVIEYSVQIVSGQLRDKLLNKLSEFEISYSCFMGVQLISESELVNYKVFGVFYQVYLIYLKEFLNFFSGFGKLFEIHLKLFFFLLSEQIMKKFYLVRSLEDVYISLI